MNRLNWFLHLRYSLFFFLGWLVFSSITPGQTQKNFNFNAAQCGQFSLQNSSFFYLPSSPNSIITSDFNNDKIPDVAVTLSNTNSIAVALGNNQTGFNASREFIAGVSPQELTVGDFNKDGEIDLAVTSSMDRLVNILLGDGDGNFNLTDSYPVGNAPRKVETADLNNDGWLDLVIGNTDSTSQSLSIYLGGAGGFRPANPGTIALDGRPYDFAVADFNRDNKLDLITIVNSTVQVLTGNGLGGFNNTLTLTVGELYALEAADFNNDGFQDFATSGYRDNKIQIYLNNGTGGFNTPIERVVANSNFLSLVAGDLNNDGKVDLATGGVFLLNDGNANFTVRENAETLNGNFVLADFNGDGIVDQVAPNGISSSFVSPNFWSFSVAYGLGGARFFAPTNFQALAGSSWAEAADFNNDSLTDIATANYFLNRVFVSYQNADGSFSASPTTIYTNGGTSHQFPVLAVADFNNDTRKDLATIIGWAYSAFILTNNANGQFSTSSVLFTNPPFGLMPSFVQPGDFNNDGKTDLVAAGTESYVVALNNGNGTFNVLNFVSLNGQGTFKTLAVGDFNADGKSDLAITRGNFNMLIFRGLGDGTFTPAGSIIIPSYASMVRSADLNGDQRSDLIVTSGGSHTGGSPALTVLIADASGGFAVINYPVTGQPNDVTIGDFNGDSIKDFLLINSPNSHATLYIGNGNGTFTAQTPIPTADNVYTAAAADFNRDQKLDVVMASKFGPTGIFYNNTPNGPCLMVNDVQVAEGDSGTTNAQFAVNLSNTATQTVSVDYRLVGRSARNNIDFTAVSGRLNFSPGTLTQTVNVPILGDTTDEIDETFQLVLSNPINADLTDALGVGTITDNDSPPNVSINDVSMVEGTGGNSTRMIFTASLSQTSGRKAKVAFSLLDGTATSGSDFQSVSGTLVFEPDETTKQIIVDISPDAFVESDETFRVKLTNPSNLVISDDEAVGMILNDDFGGTVQFEVGTLQTNETDEFVTVNVRRTGGQAAGITLDYTTANGTATANRDYLPSAGKLVFGANENLKTFVIPILDDAIDESPSETVNITLDNIAGGAVLGSPATAVLNILDDDPAPGLTLNDASLSEGNSGTSVINFNVRLLAKSEQTVIINYATANGTAVAPEDYLSASGTLTFAPGETQKNIQVTVNGDTNIEPNETFFLNLSNPVNVVLQNSQAVGTILNDDLANRQTRADFDGDGKTDYSIFRPTNGQWWLNQSTSGNTKVYQFGQSGDKIVPADFTGDGKTDVAFFRAGTWFILRSENDTFYAAPFGSAGDIPVPGDFDADGRADLAVFRPTAATWFILRSSAGTQITQFGANGDLPAVGDYDGDGKADIAIFRPNDGSWWVQRSTSGFLITVFGTASDKPVPLDYTGDGKTDIAFFRPQNNTWYVLRSEDLSFYAAPFGANGDLPVPGDFDGDGKADLAIWRMTNRTWFVLKSTGGVSVVQFGSDGDLPVPNAILP